MNRISARAARTRTSGRQTSTDTTPLRLPRLSSAGAAPLAPPDTAQANEIDRLYAALDAVTPATNPRTAKLLRSGSRKVAQKVIEEVGEVAIDAVRHSAAGVVRESADLLYHLVVLWRHAGVAPHEVWAEMKARAERLGIAEKLPKPHVRNGAKPQTKS